MYIDVFMILQSYAIYYGNSGIYVKWLHRPELSPAFSAPQPAAAYTYTEFTEYGTLRHSTNSSQFVIDIK